MKKNTLNRRDFAIKSAMGLAGIGMADASQAQPKEETAIIALLEKESVPGELEIKKDMLHAGRHALTAKSSSLRKTDSFWISQWK